MSDEMRILDLLEEMLESTGDPEDVSQQCPELMDKVRSQWERLQTVQAQVEALFPTPHQVTRAQRSWIANLGTELPKIAGYEVQALLGRGGMGVVYKARHLKLNRDVAVKMMLTEAYADLQRLTRFLREAETVAGLRHANIVQVYEAADLDGIPYFTMEF